MTTVKTLYLKDERQNEAKLEIAKFGTEYCPFIGAEVYSESKRIIFLTTEEDVRAAKKVADAQYFTHLKNSAVGVPKWEDIRA